MKTIYYKSVWATAIMLFFIIAISGCRSGGGDNNGGGGDNKVSDSPVTKPSILEQPQDTSVLEGDSATFYIVADGTLPMQYQWRRNGVDINGANSPTLTLTSLTMADNGASFSVVITNTGGNITSSSALLTVMEQSQPPSITQQPQDTSLFEGDSATFYVVADGTLPMQYQWRRNGDDITGANSPSLTLTSLTMADSGASISVVITNIGGDITSTSALLTVMERPQLPSITQQPQSLSVSSGSIAFFEVTVTGTEPLQYQWKMNGEDIAGATASSLTLNSVTVEMNGDIITVVVTNGAGSTMSAQAVLTVLPPPDDTITLALSANDLVFDPLREVIYASVPETNSISVIDPVTGDITSSIPMGNRPDILAISDDSQYLYVALADEPQIDRINLNTHSVDLTISLTPSRLGPRFAEDMEVFPGSPTSIAVSLYHKGSSPRSAGTVIFDDDTERALSISAFSDDIGPIEFGASDSRLYGYNNQTSAYSFNQMDVTPSGVSVVDSLRNLIMGIDVDIRFDSGSLYSTSGSVVDPETFALLGSIPISGRPSSTSPSTFTYNLAASVLPDVADGRVYFLVYSLGSWQIQSFDSTRLIPTGYTSVEDSSPNAGSLILCGSAGLAFRTSANIHIKKFSSFRLPLSPPVPGPGEMNLAVNDMVYDSSRGFIYSSVPGNVYSNGNSIAVIDPLNETVTQFIDVGSEPHKLALSDNFDYLYVALDGAPLVQRINLNSLFVDQTFALTTMGRGFLVEDIEVLPGSPDSFAVVRKSCCFLPDQRGIGIYDSGVLRSRDSNLGNSRSTLIVFGESSVRLYGYDTRSSAHNFQRINIDLNGVVVADSLSGLISGEAKEFKYEGGHIYVQNLSIDPEARVIHRTFQVTNMSSSVVPDINNNRVYYLTTPNFWQIEAFDATTASSTGVLVIGDDADSAGNLVRWGTDGLAFSTSNKKVYFRHTFDLH